MKRFTKVALIIAAVVGGIGICCLVGAVAKGLTWRMFANMVTDGRFSFGPEDLVDLGIGDRQNEAKDTQSKGSLTEVEEDFGSLDVDLGAGKLEIYYDDVDKVQVEQEETPGFRCYVKESTLHVEGGKKFGVNDNHAKIVIHIPRNYIFAEFELKVGAGEAMVEGIVANEVSVDVGAGKATVKKLDAKEVDASAGAGELYLEVVGKKENYSYNLECHIGELRIGEETYTGLGTEKKIKNPNANRFLEADCDIGELQIDFIE